MGRKPNVIYESGLLSEADLRIMQVHTLLKDGIKPWEWDYEHYSDENDFMKGMYYQEDWNNLISIDSMINDREGAAANRARTQEAASR